MKDFVKNVKNKLLTFISVLFIFNFSINYCAGLFSIEEKQRMEKSPAFLLIKHIAFNRPLKDLTNNENINFKMELLGNQEATLLHLATVVKNIDAINKLIDSGLDVNIQDKYGDTPLHYTVRYKNFAPVPVTLPDPLIVIKTLVERGADVNATDNLGRIPLHFVGFNKTPGIVKFFIEKGVDVNAKDKNGNTPLHGAAYNNNDLMVKELIEAEADPDLLNNQGKSALKVLKQGILERKRKAEKLGEEFKAPSTMASNLLQQASLDKRFPKKKKRIRKPAGLSASNRIITELSASNRIIKRLNKLN